VGFADRCCRDVSDGGVLETIGNPQLVGLFEAIGLGQWLRYLTGTLEVAGAILLLIPRMSGLGALMLAGS